MVRVLLDQQYMISAPLSSGVATPATILRSLAQQYALGNKT